MKKEVLTNNPYEENRTKIGNFMFVLVAFLSKPLIKYPWLIYFLNYTWGILMTIVGWLVYFFCLIFLPNKIDHKEHFMHNHILFIGKNWGGFSIGMDSVIANNMSETHTQHVRCHETGHTFHNAILGPFAIFLVYIPSVIRYYRKKYDNYDDAWYESSASEIGEEYCRYYDSEEE